jgi:hypothetical protein
MIGSFREFAVSADMPPETFGRAIEWFNAFAVEHWGRLAEGDKAQREATKTALGESWAEDFKPNMAVANAVFDRFPKSLRAAIREARLSDGRRLNLLPQFSQALFDLGTELEQAGVDYGAGGETFTASDLRAELAALSTLRDSDIEAYRTRLWRKSGKTGSDRSVELRRMLETKSVPSARDQLAERAQEIAELERLQRTDPEVYTLGRWRGGRLTPEERLAELQSAAAR